MHRYQLKFCWLSHSETHRFILILVYLSFHKDFDLKFAKCVAIEIQEDWTVECTTVYAYVCNFSPRTLWTFFLSSWKTSESGYFLFSIHFRLRWEKKTTNTRIQQIIRYSFCNFSFHSSLKSIFKDTFIYIYKYKIQYKLRLLRFDFATTRNKEKNEIHLFEIGRKEDKRRANKGDKRNHPIDKLINFHALLLIFCLALLWFFPLLAHQRKNFSFVSLTLIKSI